MKFKLLIVMVTAIFVFSCTNDSGSSNDNVKPSKTSKTSKTSQAFSFSSKPTPEDIGSLRGKHSLRSLSKTPVKMKIIKEGDFDVNFEAQPPLVPHKSDYMRVTLNNNRCLACHSNANYREEEAAKMPSSHFKTRSGKRLKTVSPRRYFCKQCHVSQIDAQPLVGNTYVNTDE